MRKFEPHAFDAAILIACVATFLVASRFDLFEAFSEYAEGHESWNLDELAIASMIALLFLPVALIRHARRLRRAVLDLEIARAAAEATAIRDALTGLYNRRHFLNSVNRLSASGWGTAGRSDFAVLLIDLDRFKPLNDLRGHEAGDRFLVALADRLRAIAGPSDMAIRLGGDEFALIVVPSAPDQSGNSRALCLARRVLAAVEEPVMLDGTPVVLTASIGVATWSEGTDAATLLRQADQAMYAAKTAGRGGICSYDAALGDELAEIAALEADLRSAVDTGQIIPWFQPVFDIASRRITGFEVLARWPHPTRGLVPPDRFIPIAEEMGLIDRLSDQLLDLACAESLNWPDDLNFAFNISPLQLVKMDLADRIAATLARHGIPGNRLEIEVTERAVVADMARARDVLERISALGVRVALDDFGTGASTLATLTDLPFSRIKIDRRFVAGVGHSPQNAKIVSSVLALAESLSLDVTAEGIEDEAELAFLQARGCHLGQGFLISRPRPATDILTLMQGDAVRRAG